MSEATGELWKQVATLADFGATRKLVRQVGGIEVLLVRVGADVVAVNNRCTHLGQPLDKGRVMSGQITCPFHGACFDLRSGAALSGPAVAGLVCHVVRLEGDSILLAPVAE
jgi:nitrite reductase/ring-hydroxylating ferredoxin subunit